MYVDSTPFCVRPFSENHRRCGSNGKALHLDWKAGRGSVKAVPDYDAGSIPATSAALPRRRRYTKYMQSETNNEAALATSRSAKLAVVGETSMANDPALLLEHIKRRLEELHARVSAAESAIARASSDRAEWIDQRRALLAWRRELRSRIPNGNPQLRESGGPGRLLGLTARQVLHQLGSESGGVLFAADAIDATVQAGYYKDVKTASASIYTELRRGCDRGEWHKEEAGVYRQLRYMPLIDSEVPDSRATEVLGR